MSKFSNEELKEILSRPVEIWPACRCEHYCKPRNYKREPSPDQLKVFKSKHSHGIRIVLGYGGTRTGKSKVGVAKGFEYAFANPGCTILVGADTREILKRTAMKDWQDLLSIHEPWDHPLVYRKPNDHNKALILRIPYVNEKGESSFKLTTVWFLHFRDFKILRGTGVTYIHIEEASLIKEPGVLKELLRRCDENIAKQRMIYISTNPEESKGWIYETFNLKQFEPEYTGPPMDIGERCKCQFCTSCINNLENSKEVEYVNGVCPECGTKKMVSCEGNVDFMEVVMFRAANNPHNPPSYFQDNLNFTSDIESKLYLMGQVVELNQGKVYEDFSKENVLNTNIPLDYSKDMFWSFDFNKKRQCSVICQEVPTPNGTEVYVLDEIVIPPVPGDPHKVKVGPKIIAKEFLKRFPKFDQPIHLYGDPSALNGKQGSDDDKNEYQIILDIITDPFKRNKYGDLEYLTEEEFKYFTEVGLVPKTVKVMPIKEKGKTKIFVRTKVDSTNAKLKDPSGKCWIHINPKCEWLILSLDSLKWKNVVGKDQIDTACDKSDDKNPDKATVRLVSHISDALGYYIAKKWPVVRTPNNNFAVVPGEYMLEVVGDSLVENIVERSPEELTTREKLSSIDPVPGSILEFFHDNGYFDDYEDTFIGYFG